MLSKKEIYQQATQKLQAIRHQQSEVYRQHLAHAIAVEPAIETLQRELSLMSLSLSKMVLSEQKDIRKLLVALKEKSQTMQQEIVTLLEKHDLPKDYLQRTPVCKLCQDQGYRDGKHCQCFYDLVSQISAEDLQKTAHLQLESFSSFSLDYYTMQNDPNVGRSPYEHMAQVLSFCKRFADSFTRDKKGILMLGKTGLGKTHLSLAIANDVIKQGYIVLYATASDLTRQLSQEHFGRSTSDFNQMERICSAELLIMDDLGAEFESSFSTSAIYDIINTRICGGLPTIVSTNLGVEDLQKRYGARVVSRLYSELTPLAFLGDDVRLLKDQKLERRSLNERI